VIYLTAMAVAWWFGDRAPGQAGRGRGLA